MVGEAEDGASALAAVEELCPELVLLDVVLPDTDGFAVAEQLAQGGTGPVVVLTSSRDATDLGQRLERSPVQRLHPQGRALGRSARQARCRPSMSRRLLVALALAGATVTAAAVALELFAHGFQPFSEPEKVAQCRNSTRSGSPPV